MLCYGSNTTIGLPSLNRCHVPFVRIDADSWMQARVDLKKWVVSQRQGSSLGGHHKALDTYIHQTLEPECGWKDRWESRKHQNFPVTAHHMR